MLMGFDNVKSFTRCDICPLGKMLGYKEGIECNADPANDMHALICAMHGIRREGVTVNAQVGFLVDMLEPLREFLDKANEDGLKVQGTGWDGQFEVVVKQKE